MSSVISKTANFGTAYTGLSTVGYTLTGGTRTTSGVTELVAGTGIYTASVTFADGFVGQIVWDTGGGSPVYAVEDIDLSTSSAVVSSASTGLPTTFLTSRESKVLCTDEDVAIRCTEDFAKICPRTQRLAYGSDGSTTAAGPWVLTSVAVNFANQGLQPGTCILLTKNGSFAAQGELFAVDSVSGATVTLRRPGLASSVGQPISLADLASITFDARTFAPQIDNATYHARKFFGIDNTVTGSSLTDLYDARELQQYTVLHALLSAYVAAEKTQQTDFSLKIGAYKAELNDLVSMLTIRWGSKGDGKPVTSIFSARMRR